ncbi:uncharacterized protein LOC129588949 [Paramacrobiotus metropolitanus]|uniref:uncharacterized protein LOC129588949 n=1 Tax=Paramacrobiotus metropolitanus TaxID=2943436 RepID=UPI00244626C2|nr:uncharacterized protein LOC129588949 [Paramacrobiotus metropolitanus]XP_055339357.1 uncharacterized protein LOC129588949 [Paramacrobiotus metropolitanus]XP_055339358.1 uncharacterized protein LOC129588949 [Paramacrobiotus metropolitanus]
MEDLEGDEESKRPQRGASLSEPIADESQRDPTQVDVLLRGHFNEDFQPTQTTFPIGFRKVITPCELNGFVGAAASFRQLLPSSSYCSMYADVSNSRDVMLQKAGGAVCAAYEIAYGDQIAVFSAFMTAALEAQQKPYQPQTSMHRFLAGMHEKRQDDRTRLAQFVAMLPGFADVSPADREVLLAEKAFISTLLHHMKYAYKGEYYCTLPGPEQIHASDYWMEILGVDTEFCRFCFKFSAVFNGIGLSLTETYLLMAAAFFDPRTTTASDKALLMHLHMFYMDALTHMIGYRRRQNPTERTAVFNKLTKAAAMFPAVHQMSLDWYVDTERTLPPLPAPSKTLVQDCLKH